MRTDTLPSAAALLDARAAMRFMADHLPSYEAQDFAKDWLDGKPMKPWLDALEYDRRNVAGEPLGDIRHLLGNYPSS